MKISLLYKKKKIQWIVKKKFGRRSSFPFLSKYFARKPYPEIHFTFPRRSSFVKSVNSAKQILGLFKYVHIVHMCRHRAQSRWCHLRLLWVYFLLFYWRKNYSAEMIPELHGNVSHSFCVDNMSLIQNYCGVQVLF